MTHLIYLGHVTSTRVTLYITLHHVWKRNSVLGYICLKTMATSNTLQIKVLYAKLGSQQTFSSLLINLTIKRLNETLCQIFRLQ